VVTEDERAAFAALMVPEAVLGLVVGAEWVDVVEVLGADECDCTVPLRVEA
jgi:hypothetical protein